MGTAPSIAYLCKIIHLQVISMLKVCIKIIKLSESLSSGNNKSKEKHCIPLHHQHFNLLTKEVTLE